MSIKFLKLYRDILKQHKTKLPINLRAIGDEYVKKEFRLHKTAKDAHREMFFNNWTQYLLHIKSQESNFGKEMAPNDITLLNSEQKSKLEELKVETKNLTKF